MVNKLIKNYSSLNFIYIDLKNQKTTEIKFTDKLKQEYEEKLLKILKDIEKSLKLNIFSQQKECKYCEYYKLCHY